MEHRKNEEEYIYKIKQSIYESNEGGSQKHTRLFRKSIANCSGFSLYIFIFLLFNNYMLDDNKSPVQSSTQIKPKQKMSLLKIHH